MLTITWLSTVISDGAKSYPITSINFDAAYQLVDGVVLPPVAIDRSDAPNAYHHVSINVVSHGNILYSSKTVCHCWIFYRQSSMMKAHGSGIVPPGATGVHFAET